jgi:hypothetical protein
LANEPQPASIGFSTVIASRTRHEELIGDADAGPQPMVGKPARPVPQTAEQGVIEFEFAHLNGMLRAVAGAVQAGRQPNALQPAYHELDDFIEAQLARHQEVFASRGIAASFEVDPLSPLGFFDRELIASVLANSINNAIRYARMRY